MRTSLPVIVQDREGREAQWSELTHLLDVTPFGASFSISRMIDVGRLVHLALPMPRQLRCFDHADDQYRVWALVRYAQPLPTGDAKEKFAVGVAFVGKHPPRSYHAQPEKLYEAKPLNDPAPQAAALGAGRDDAREGTRLNMPVDVMLEVINHDGSLSAMRERTVTENLSRRGASVFTTLNVARGTRVRLTSVSHQMSITAFVLANRVGADGQMRLHLKFADEQWPIEGIS